MWCHVGRQVTKKQGLYDVGANITVDVNDTDDDDDDDVVVVVVVVVEGAIIPVDAGDTDDDDSPHVILAEMLDDLHIGEDATGGEGAAMMD